MCASGAEGQGQGPWADPWKEGLAASCTSGLSTPCYGRGERGYTRGVSGDRGGDGRKPAGR